MVIRDIKDIDKVKSFILSQEKLAVDIETTGLLPRSDKIIGIGFSNDSEGFYLVHLEWVDDKLVERIPLEVCKEITALIKDKKWVGWNSSFEVRFIRHYFGVDLLPSLHSEGMLAVHTVDENRRNYKLKDIAEDMYGAGAVDEQKAMKESIKNNGGDPSCDYYMADSQIMGEYCIVDCLLTYKIDQEYLQKLSQKGLSDFYFKKEVMPMYKTTVVNMEDNGVVVDVDRLRTLAVECRHDIFKLEASIQEQIAPYLDEFTAWYLGRHFPVKPTGEFSQYVCRHFKFDLPKTKSGKFSLSSKALGQLEAGSVKSFLEGKGELPEEHVIAIQKLWLEDQDDQNIFNISSKDHLKRLFFDKLDENPVSKTDKGNPQVDHLFLLNMCSKHEWVKDLIVYNKLKKQLGTYLENYANNSVNGVYHPSWFMHRTTSGRLGGNLMQLPRKIEDDTAHPLVLKYNNSIRDCIISGKGHKLIGADYSSLEVVVFAADAKEEILLDMIRNDEDFYSRVYIDIHDLGDKFSADKTSANYFKKLMPNERQEAKVYSLGLRYNMQSFKLSKTLDISEAQAKDIIKKYFASYPKLKIRMDELMAQAKKMGYVKSEGGRVRNLPMLKKLYESYGDSLLDGLELWKKYNSVPKKYKQMKYLASQYRSDINNCLNFPIQSMAATITNRACIALSREFVRQGLKAYVCMQIHDEVVVRCPDKEVDKVSKLMKFIMENTTRLSVPLTAEPEVGTKYGDIK